MEPALHLLRREILSLATQLEDWCDQFVATMTEKKAVASRKRVVRRRDSKVKSAHKATKPTASKPYLIADDGPDEKDRAFLGHVQEDLERLE